MSRVYVLEPPTRGKVLLKTSVGDIDIELWSKECPNACRNFVQHCFDGYYDKTIFHRVVQGFIIQGGDPSDTGSGGVAAFGAPFKDEIHSRLHFNRRGLVGVAKNNDENGSQFFFTLDEASELDGKHTLFGKVVGNTIFNMLRIADGEIGEDERPVYPHRIISAEVLSNPFPDLFPRTQECAEVGHEQASNKSPKVKPVRSRAIRDFGLLSFGDEARKDDASMNQVKKEVAVRVRSAHDIGDPQLLKEEVPVEPCDVPLPGDRQLPKQETLEEREQAKKAMDIKRQRQMIRKEIVEIRKELQTVVEQDIKRKAELEPSDGSFVAQFNREALKISQTKEDVHAKKGTGKSREIQTMDLLSRFKRKMDEMLKSESEESRPEGGEALDVLFNHELESVETQQIRAIDASREDDVDRYDIYDPRNPMNKRRREAVAPSEQSALHRTRFQNK